jgi:hypothetical protein
MKTYPQFHDGFFDGFWLPAEDTINVYLRTEAGSRFVLRGQGLVALTAGAFRKGNIILDVLVRERDEISLDDITELYNVQPDSKTEGQIQLLTRAREKLQVLEVNPSYGGQCLIMASKFDCLDWESFLAHQAT